MISQFLTASVLLVPIVMAQQGEWQQCGGIGWSGETTCVSGTVCTSLNDYYSQCLAGAATTTSTTSKSTTTTASPSGPSVTPNFWFSFGDSYTQTDFDPTGTLPSVGNPLGNPAYPGYTGGGGVNWIDVDTVVYNKSLILTYNYAYGGATIDASLVPPSSSTILTLTDQVNEFLSGAATKPATAPWTSTNSLFSFWIGINDIGNTWSSSGNRSAFAELLLGAYFTDVQKVYDVGARNFLFINVPPVDRSPLMAESGAAAQAAEKAVIIDFNNRLATHVSQFKSNNSDINTWLWDSWSAFSTVLDDATAYGFVDNTSYGNAGDFWGNNYHPSAGAQTIWGQDVANLLSDTIW